MLHLKWSLIISAIVIIGTLVLAGPSAAFLVVMLGLLEVSVSFDNAIVNAGILRRMNAFWQQMFLTVGIVIAVFGVRLILPLLIVAISAHIGPVEVVQKALAGGSADHPGTYGYLLSQARPVISAFGGIFLLVLALDFFFDDRNVRWIVWIEKPLAKIGQLRFVSAMISVLVLVLVAIVEPSHSSNILIGGIVGLMLYLCVSGLGKGFERAAGTSAKAGLFLFLYLQVLDASFSFDGVIGAFAISNEILIIAAGLGIGAVFIRSLTVLMVREGTLNKFRFLEHGAHWAIAALAVIMLVGITTEISGVVTGLVSALFIGASLAHSMIANRRERS